MGVRAGVPESGPAHLLAALPRPGPAAPTPTAPPPTPGSGCKLPRHPARPLRAAVARGAPGPRPRHSRPGGARIAGGGAAAGPREAPRPLTPGLGALGVLGGGSPAAWRSMPGGPRLGAQDAAARPRDARGCRPRRRPGANQPGVLPGEGRGAGSRGKGWEEDGSGGDGREAGRAGPGRESPTCRPVRWARRLAERGGATQVRLPRSREIASTPGLPAPGTAFGLSPADSHVAPGSALRDHSLRWDPTLGS